MTRRMRRSIALAVLLLVLGGLAVLLLGGPALRGTRWRLIDPPSANPITLEFAADQNQLGGSAGCNSYGGRYVRVGALLLVRELSQTLMACMAGLGVGGPVMQQEADYLQALGRVAAYRVRGSQLTLVGPDGRPLLVFERAP